MARKTPFWVINGAEGYKPGQIGRAGINMGVPEVPEDSMAWGGCLEDVYCITGKTLSSLIIIHSGVRPMLKTFSILFC